MKNHFINLSDISEVFVKEPREKKENEDSIFSLKPDHGWQVVIVMRSLHPAQCPLVLDKDSEKDCLDFIEKLGLFQIA